MSKFRPSLEAKGNKRLERFIGVMILSLIGVFIGSWIATNYFGASTNAILSFAQADGWCSSTNPGLGVHCFGDYGYTILLPLENPYSNWRGVPHSYPPLANAFFLPFRAIAASGHAGIALALYELILSACLLLPLLHLVTVLRPRLTGAAIAIAVAGPLTTPFLIAIDRGNNVGILVPFIYATYRAVARERYDVAALLVIVMTNWRPQMILFAIIFLSLRRYRQLLMVALIAPLSLVLTFGMFGSSSVVAFHDWWSAVSSYQNMTKFPSLFPYNLSLSNTVSLIVEQVHHQLAPTSAYLTSWENHTKIIGGSAILVSCLAAWHAGRHRKNTKQVLLMVTLLPILATPTSFGYYLVVLLVPLAFVAADWLIRSGSATRRYDQGTVSALSLARCTNRWEEVCWYCFATLSVVVLVPWPVTEDILPRGATLGGSLPLLLAGTLLAATWMAATIAAAQPKQARGTNDIMYSRSRTERR